MADHQSTDVFIVDDDAPLRAAMSRLLGVSGLRCEAFGCPEAFLARITPDTRGCVLLDVRMPGHNGIDVQRVLRQRGCDLSIVFVTAHADVPLTVRAMKDGALEVLTKPFDGDQLLSVVQSALAANRARARAADQLRAWRARYDTLTPREREVMVKVADGLLNKQVADVLGIAEKTVKVHRGQVMQKMQAASLADLVRMTDRLGVGPDRQDTHDESGRAAPDDVD